VLNLTGIQFKELFTMKIPNFNECIRHGTHSDDERLLIVDMHSHNRLFVQILVLKFVDKLKVDSICADKFVIANGLVVLECNKVVLVTDCNGSGITL
jgi:hypothetical protein